MRYQRVSGRTRRSWVSLRRVKVREFGVNNQCEGVMGTRCHEVMLPRSDSILRATNVEAIASDFGCTCS